MLYCWGMLLVFCYLVLFILWAGNYPFTCGWFFSPITFAASPLVRCTCVDGTQGIGICIWGWLWRLRGCNRTRRALQQSSHKQNANVFCWWLLADSIATLHVLLLASFLILSLLSMGIFFGSPFSVLVMGCLSNYASSDFRTVIDILPVA